MVKFCSINRLITTSDTRSNSGTGSMEIHNSVAITVIWNQFQNGCLVKESKYIFDAWLLRPKNVSTCWIMDVLWGIICGNGIEDSHISDGIFGPLSQIDLKILVAPSEIKRKKFYTHAHKMLVIFHPPSLWVLTIFVSHPTPPVEELMTNT